MKRVIGGLVGVFLSLLAVSSAFGYPFTPTYDERQPTWISAVGMTSQRDYQKVVISKDGNMGFVSHEEYPRFWITPWTEVFDLAGQRVDGARVEAFDTATGKPLWRVANGEIAGVNGLVPMVLSPDGGTLFVGGMFFKTPRSGPRAVVAYRASDGTELWRTGVPGDAPLDIAVSPDGSRLFVTGYLLATQALDTSNGSLLWSTAESGSGNRRGNDLEVGEDGRVVYVGGQDDANPSNTNGALFAYDAETGVRLWRGAPPAPSSPIKRAKLSADGKRLIALTSSYTYAYDAAGGTQLWKTLTPHNWTGFGGLVMLDQAVVTATDYRGHTLKRLNIESGAVEWVSTAGSSPLVEATLSPNQREVIVATGSVCSVRAYDADSGKLIWSGCGYNYETGAIALNPTGDAAFISGYDFVSEALVVARICSLREYDPVRCERREGLGSGLPD